MGRGIFITFEGGEGSGKTTLIQKLAASLSSHGQRVFTAREPGGSELSEKIRGWLLDSSAKISPLAELLLFLAARAQHISEKIAPALEEGKIVLCDRFNDSTIVYQGIARNLGMDYVKQLCEQVTQKTRPDLTLFLDVDPETGLKRAGGTPDRIEAESKEFHRLVRKGYQTLAAQEPDRIKTIDASKPIDTVFAEALKLVENRLSRHV